MEAGWEGGLGVVGDLGEEADWEGVVEEEAMLYIDYSPKSEH